MFGFGNWDETSFAPTEMLYEMPTETRAKKPAFNASAVYPSHYHRGGLEAFDVIDKFELTYHVGTAVAYLLRAGKKTPDGSEDMRKAVRHLQREIQRLSK